MMMMMMGAPHCRRSIRWFLLLRRRQDDSSLGIGQNVLNFGICRVHVQRNGSALRDPNSEQSDAKVVSGRKVDGDVARSVFSTVGGRWGAGITPPRKFSIVAAENDSVVESIREETSVGEKFGVSEDAIV